MADQKLSEEMIKHVWHTYLTTGDMPESLNAPLVGRKFLRPLIKRLPQNPIPYRAFKVKPAFV